MSDDKELPFCDLIMKGGITSGVIYPRLISRLAKDYRFKSIGGTSAGAIAAAGCAAAEYGRHHLNPEAFERLEKLPDELCEKVGGTQDSRLFHFFQPAGNLARHFEVLTGMLNQKDKKVAALQVVLAMLRIFWRPAALGVAALLILLTPTFMVASGLSMFGALFATLVLSGICAAWLWLAATRLSLPKDLPTAMATLALPLAGLALLYAWLFTGASLLAALGIAIVSVIVVPACVVLALSTTTLLFGKSLLDGMAENFYGICSGHKEPSDQAPQALTDWLADYFNQLAGLPREAPLTFGHLWGDPPSLESVRSIEQVNALASEMPRHQRLLNLEVMTTAVSQNMAFAIPLREGSGAFYYDPDEWAALFPKSVMAWINSIADEIAAVKAADSSSKGKPARPAAAFRQKPLKRLPPNCFLPVVVAVRMSLSFPILLSAIPLYAQDFSMRDKPMKRVWFSDGGICSNLPLHMFDAPLPSHPTFAVNLKGEHPDHLIDDDADDDGEAPGMKNGRVYLPSNNSGGRLRYWQDSAEGPFGLFSLLWEMVNTMQVWRDEIQFPYPGFRDRIVQISQRANEGGLNLNMPEENIRALSDAGSAAADLLIKRFHSVDGASSAGWENHEEYRLHTFLGLVELVTLNPTVVSSHWDQVVERRQKKGKLNSSEAALAKQLLQKFRDMNQNVQKTQNNGDSLNRKSPLPRAILRIVPRI